MQSFNTLEIVAFVCLGFGAVLLPFCWVKAIDRTVNVLGLLFFGILGVNLANENRLGHWRFGPALTPVEIRGPDGRHTDGTPVTEFSDGSPVYYWFCYLVCGGCLARSWWHNRKQKRRPVPVFRAGEKLGIRRVVNAHRQDAAINPAGREDLIESLCGRTGSLLISREGDRYWVRPPCATRGQRIRIVASDRSVLFQEYLDVEFPLDREPPGLFARLMLRNFNLFYAAWNMTIGGRCDALVCVCARIPTASLDAGLFDTVCREIVSEVEGFHQELREKFRYGVGGGTDAGRQPGRGGVPMRKPWDNDLPEIRYFN
jgi:hypothetical protein